jgi:hypothetical protein
MVVQRQDASSLQTTGHLTNPGRSAPLLNVTYMMGILENMENIRPSSQPN